VLPKHQRGAVITALYVLETISLLINSKGSSDRELHNQKLDPKDCSVAGIWPRFGTMGQNSWRRYDSGTILSGLPILDFYRRTKHMLRKLVTRKREDRMTPTVGG